MYNASRIIQGVLNLVLSQFSLYSLNKSGEYLQSAVNLVIFL